MGVTPRTTRLLRASSLAVFRHSLAELASGGGPLEARERCVVVPTRAAAAYLTAAIESRALAAAGALVLPDFVTPRELVRRLGERLPVGERLLEDPEREVLLAVACRSARGAGCDPPFRLRPGLVSEMLRFYDDLRRNHRDVDSFERLALGRLEAGASIDRGADRLARQTRFMVAAYRELERRTHELGLDEHGLRARLANEAAARPVRHVVVAVGDHAFDRHGLHPADWDLLARLPLLERLDVVVTDTALAGAPHERIHAMLPGIEEVRLDAGMAAAPALVVPGDDAPVWTARDREEEVALFARRCKHAARIGRPLDRMALVVDAPLPYVYVAREVCRSAGVPLQMFDALPLAAEPYAAAFDLVCSVVTSGFAREPCIALLRSPQFRFARDDARPRVDAGGQADEYAEGLSLRDIADLDRALAETGYLGELDALERLRAGWRAGRPALADAAGRWLAEARRLEPLRSPQPPAGHLSVLLECLQRWERPPAQDAIASRHRRARSAVLDTIRTLRDAYARLDEEPAPFESVAALVRRWIDGQTFAPRTGAAGVHLVDAESARFGDFDDVQIAGVVESEWPERPRRNIFYPAEILRELGWPAESGRREAARARFVDLLHLPAASILVSTFTLEADSLVSPSTLLEDLRAAALPSRVEPLPTQPIFEHEALSLDVPVTAHLAPETAAWARHRVPAGERRARAFRGFTAPHRPRAFSLSGLERYQDCPFRFFSSHVLRLEEDSDDGRSVSPRTRGRLVHEVFQRFFQAWDAEGGGSLTPDRFDRARALFADVAGPLLARLPESDAALERQRLFGSAIALGTVDVLLAAEAARPERVDGRWLEYRLEGAFELGGGDGRRVALDGVADRVDLLPGRRLRVIDYKSGAAPGAARALQAPVYALCASERLASRDGAPWTVEEAGYLAFAGRRAFVPVVRPGEDPTAALAAARERVFAAVDGIHHGEFPARPHDPLLCRACSFVPVCRKDYAHDL